MIKESWRETLQEPLEEALEEVPEEIVSAEETTTKKKLKRERGRKALVVLFTSNKSNELFTLLVLQNCEWWGFPKGLIEEGETDKQAAFRELREETRIDLRRVPHEILHKKSVRVGRDIHEVFYIRTLKNRSCFDEVPIDVGEVCVTKWLRVARIPVDRYFRKYDFNSISRMLLEGILEDREIFRRDFALTKSSPKRHPELLRYCWVSRLQTSRGRCI